MKTYIFSLFLFLLTFSGIAQTRQLKGIVQSKLDTTIRLSATIVSLDDPTNSVNTDKNGEFTITLPIKKVKLQIQSSNYNSQTISIKATQKQVTISLMPQLVLVEVEEKTEEMEAAPKREKRKEGLKAKRKVHSTLSKSATIERSYEKREAWSDSHSYDGYLSDDVSSDKSGGGEISFFQNAPKASMLTAGELDDFSKWKMWEDISNDDLSRYQKAWELQPLDRYSVQLTTAAGFPIVDAQLVMKDKLGNVIWESRTDNTGKGELWNNLFVETQYKVASVEAIVNGEIHQFAKPTTFKQGINSTKLNIACNMPDAVDIAFVVDATASMSDEIEYLKVELEDIIKKVKDSISSSTINLGSVFYRDHDDDYLTVKSDFSEEVSTTSSFIGEQAAGGGGDYPEAVEEGLEVAINQLNWSKSAKARLLFLILDAPPHNDSVVRKKLKDLAAAAAKKGIRIIPVTASGIDKSTEYLMRSLALATNGTYTFLTDDSGIGNSHIKPTTDKYDVELLNDLMVRLILEYTHSSDCQQLPNNLLTTADTAIHLDTLVNTNPIATDTTITKVDTDPAPVFTWKYYPNPTNGKITVELSQKVEELFITDITGKILLRVEPKTDVPTLVDLSPYPTGIYFIKFMVDKKAMMGRVLVSRGGVQR